MRTFGMFSDDELEKELKRRKAEREKIVKKGEKPKRPRKPKGPGVEPEKHLKEEVVVYEDESSWQTIDIGELQLPLEWEGEAVNYIIHVEGVTCSCGCGYDTAGVELSVHAVRLVSNPDYEDQLAAWKKRNEEYKKKLKEHEKKLKQYEKDIAEWHKR